MTTTRQHSTVTKNILRLLSILILIGEVLIRHTSRSGNQPYFDKKEFPWTQLLEQDWKDIQTELDTVLAERERIPAFHEISPEQEVLGVDKGWKVYAFFVFGHAIQQNCMSCPKTSALLKQIPGLRNAMFSILEPQRSIPVHRGPYKGLLRYHLGLYIPAGEDKLSITVNEIKHGWQEGKTLILDDSFPHFVTNNCNKQRVVLFADFIRPLPWPVSMYNWLVIKLFEHTPLAKDPVARINKSSK